MKVSIFGIGFVGNSIYKSLKLKNFDVKGYDKYKFSDTFEECIDDQIARYGDQDTAERICGYIKSEYGS